MDFSLNEDQKMFLELAQRFVGKEVSPKVIELDEKGEFPREIMDKAWEVGFMNLYTPTADYCSFI